MPKGNLEPLQMSRSTFVVHKSNEDELVDKKIPSPKDFGEYLSWACTQLQLQFRVNVIKNHVNEYVSISDKKSKKQKAVAVHSRHDINTDQSKSSSVRLNQALFDSGFKIITIYTIYDHFDNLVQLSFGKDYKVPTDLLKLIGLIIPFQVYLTGLAINRGIDNISLYQLNKFLLTAYITDICLDNTYNANYYILLEKEHKLRQLSLARCKINDDNLKKIASQLSYPLPSAQTLLVLNLASNEITDIGAQCLAEALRSNRELVYLNLADNSIGDKGAISILSVLKEFPVSAEELTLSSMRYVAFIKQKKCFPSQTNLPSADSERKQSRKSVKPTRTESLFPTAKKRISEAKYEFIDPFSPNQIHTKDGKVYCYGNNQLAYLNISYNDISYFTVKALLAALNTQKSLDRLPRGLINVSIEGNNIPNNCCELDQIDEILNTYLSVFCTRTHTTGRKRTNTARSAKS